MEDLSPLCIETSENTSMHTEKSLWWCCPFLRLVKQRITEDVLASFLFSVSSFCPSTWQRKMTTRKEHSPREIEALGPYDLVAIRTDRLQDSRSTYERMSTKPGSWTSCWSFWLKQRKSLLLNLSLMHCHWTGLVILSFASDRSNYPHHHHHHRCRRMRADDTWNNDAYVDDC